MTRRTLLPLMALAVLCAVPAHAQKPAKMPLILTFTTIGYALPKADAQAAIGGLAAGADASTAMQAVSGNKNAKVTVMVALCTPSGQRAGLTVPQMVLEVDPVLGPDGRKVSLKADISVNGKPLKVQGAMVQVGSVHYAGMLETPGSDTVEAIFIRVQVQ
jgi:hypothetical protein